MKKIFLYISAIIFVNPVFAQPADKVNQLVSAENYFAAQVKEKGLRKAFTAVSDESTIIFRPGPVQAEKFYKSISDTSRGLIWEPVYARISKSSDWGFTTGPYSYKNLLETGYGDYLSVWKKNQKGVWKLALNFVVPHQKPLAKTTLIFLNAATEKFQYQHSDARLKQREDIVLSTDKLFATTLNADNKIAFEEFMDDDCRLLFPGYESFIGRNAITAFLGKQNIKVSTQPVKADRAFSGELAYTYGTVDIQQNGKTKQYHYVRIWAMRAGYIWKVILEAYTESGKLNSYL